VTFKPGVYRFIATADDGLRFFLDADLLLDEWHESSGEKSYKVERSLSGPHRLVMEYYDRAGPALVKRIWTRVGDIPTQTPTATSTARPAPTSRKTPSPTATLPPTETTEPTPTETATPEPTETETSAR